MPVLAKSVSPTRVAHAREALDLAKSQERTNQLKHQEEIKVGNALISMLVPCVVDSNIHFKDYHPAYSELYMRPFKLSWEEADLPWGVRERELRSYPSSPAET